MARFYDYLRSKVTAHPPISKPRVSGLADDGGMVAPGTKPVTSQYLNSVDWGSPLAAVVKQSNPHPLPPTSMQFPAGGFNKVAVTQGTMRGIRDGSAPKNVFKF